MLGSSQPIYLYILLSTRQHASAFNQPLTFNTSSVTDMSFMFTYANSLSEANKLLIRCAWAGTSAGGRRAWVGGSA